MQVAAQAFSQKLLARVVASRTDDFAIPVAYARAVMLTGACAAVSIPLLPFAIPILYGSGFAAAVAPGIVIIVASVFGAGAMTLQAASRARGDVSACLMSETVGMFGMLVVAVPASVHFGLMGLAGGYLAGRVMSLAWMVRATVRRGDAGMSDLLLCSRARRRCRRDDSRHHDEATLSGADAKPSEILDGRPSTKAQ
jgi:O-antigen/teichoic acid export membrane protein